jgi:rhodanese-related sulfurtransferase
MDRTAPSISASELYTRIGVGSAAALLDLRSDRDFRTDNRLIVGAVHRSPADVGRWSKDLSQDRPVVVYCAEGGEISQAVAASLRQAGFTAAYLAGGAEGWKAKELPTRERRGSMGRKWVTREHPKIDRIACPWLISRFVDPLAEFLYVPAAEVTAVAEAENATPYDIKDCEFGHVGDRCSFDAIIRIFGIRDRALDYLAMIVRGADTSRPELTPQCEGLLAISYGLSANCDDHEMLKHGLVIYDALYTWCRMRGGTHQGM